MDNSGIYVICCISLIFRRLTRSNADSCVGISGEADRLETRHLEVAYMLVFPELACLALQEIRFGWKTQVLSCYTGIAFSSQTHRKEPAIMLTFFAVRSLSRDAKLLVWTSSILSRHELSKAVVLMFT
jgi:hypothetical protein